jgi:hypothetical protein
MVQRSACNTHNTQTSSQLDGRLLSRDCSPTVRIPRSLTLQASVLPPSQKSTAFTAADKNDVWLAEMYSCITVFPSKEAHDKFCAESAKPWAEGEGSKYADLRLIGVEGIEQK